MVYYINRSLNSALCSNNHLKSVKCVYKFPNSLSFNSNESVFKWVISNEYIYNLLLINGKIVESLILEYLKNTALYIWQFRKFYEY